MELIEDLGMIDTGAKSKVRFGIYKCPDCSTDFKARTSNVKRGKTKRCSECGYLISGAKREKHGLHGSKLYWVWQGMKQRVFNTKHKSYIDYGGRGVSMCDEWANDYESFYTWANNNGYQEGLTIERRDNDGSYEPDNCKWATMLEQSKNKRTRKTK